MVVGVALGFAPGCGEGDDDVGDTCPIGGRSGSGGLAGASGDGNGGTSGDDSGDAGDAGDAGATSKAGSTSGDSGMGGRSGGGSGGGSGGSAGMTGGTGGSSKAACGNRMIETGEECDDGNTLDGDGCSALCTERCEECERAHCVLPFSEAMPSWCFEGIPVGSVAETGPGAGVLRSTLCRGLLTCMRETGCMVDDSSTRAIEDVWGRCYCGSSDFASCVGGDPQGPCIEEWNAAAESDSPSVVAEQSINPERASGWAFQMTVYCDYFKCPKECVLDEPATACDRCMTSEVQPYDKCGDLAYVDCIAGDQRALCRPVLDCAARTRCGASGIEACWGDGSGPCATEVRAAAASTLPAEITARFRDPAFALGDAGLALDCQASACAAECFPAGG